MYKAVFILTRVALNVANPIYGLLNYCKPSFQFFNVINREVRLQPYIRSLLEVLLPQDS